MKLDTLVAKQEQIKIDCENAVEGKFVTMLQSYFRDQEEEFLNYLKTKLINVINHKQELKDFVYSFNWNMFTTDLVDILRVNTEKTFKYGIENARLGINQVVKLQKDLVKTKDINADVLVGYVNSPDYARDAMTFINHQQVQEMNILSQLGKNIDNVTANKIYGELSIGFANLDGMNQLAERVQDVFNGCSQTRALMIARTETMRAFNASTIDSYKMANISLVQWCVSNDERLCEVCMHQGGKIFKIEEHSEGATRLFNPLNNFDYFPNRGYSDNSNRAFNYFFSNKSDALRMDAMIDSVGYKGKSSILNGYEFKYMMKQNAGLGIKQDLVFYDKNLKTLFFNGKYYSGDLSKVRYRITDLMLDGKYRLTIGGSHSPAVSNEFFIHKELFKEKFVFDSVGDIDDRLFREVMNIFSREFRNTIPRGADFRLELAKILGKQIDDLSTTLDITSDIYAYDKIGYKLPKEFTNLLKDLGLSDTNEYAMTILDVVNTEKRGHLSLDRFETADYEDRLQYGIDTLMADVKHLGYEISKEEAKELVDACIAFSQGSGKIRAAFNGTEAFRDYMKRIGYQFTQTEYELYAKYAERIEKFIRLSPTFEEKPIFGEVLSRGFADNKDVLTNAKVGDIINLGGPASTTSNYETATEFMYRNLVSGHKGYVFEFDGIGNLNSSIKHISNFLTEDEVIMSGMQEFKILEITQAYSADGNYIRMVLQPVP